MPYFFQIKPFLNFYQLQNVLMKCFVFIIFELTEERILFELMKNI